MTTPPTYISSVMIPTKPGSTVVVDAGLDRRLTMPMRIGTGADFTALTPQVARVLRRSSLDHLPERDFKTAGGAVRFPIVTLPSLRVDAAEACDVEVAIEIDGHLHTGLLGMTFLRQLKGAVDHRQRQVTLER